MTSALPSLSDAKTSSYYGDEILDRLAYHIAEGGYFRSFILFLVLQATPSAMVLHEPYDCRNDGFDLCYFMNAFGTIFRVILFDR